MHNLCFRNPAKYLLSIIAITILFFMSSGQELQAQDNGEQLFKVCAACHTIGGGNLIGPDLQGVTERLDRDWLVKFIINSQELVLAGDEYAVKIFEEYNKIPMPPNNMTPEQVDVLLAYIKNYDAAAKTEEAAAEPYIEEADEHARADEYVFMADSDNPFSNLQISFYISIILILVSLFDLIITKIIKARFIHLIIILISVAVVTEVTVLEAQNLGRQQYYEPDQPV